MPSGNSLKGKLLLAMPGMPDPRFAWSVILICEHGPQGTMGLILNREMPEAVAFADLLGQLDIEAGPACRDVPIRWGGPVSPGRGFVLHECDPAAAPPSAGEIIPGLALTTTRDILSDFATGAGPQRAVLLLGHAGWSAGQLEGEIAANGWLIGDASEAAVFGADQGAKWATAMQRMGVNPAALSSAAGRA